MWHGQGSRSPGPGETEELRGSAGAQGRRQRDTKRGLLSTRGAIWEGKGNSSTRWDFK